MVFQKPKFIYLPTIQEWKITPLIFICFGATCRLLPNSIYVVFEPMFIQTEKHWHSTMISIGFEQYRALDGIKNWNV
jgi:hypothetical protein